MAKGAIKVEINRREFIKAGARAVAMKATAESSASTKCRIGAYYFPNFHIDPLNGADSFTPLVKDNTPEMFLAALTRAKARMDSGPKVPRGLTMNSWNEWTKGRLNHIVCGNALKLQPGADIVEFAETYLRLKFRWVGQGMGSYPLSRQLLRHARG